VSEDLEELRKEVAKLKLDVAHLLALLDQQDDDPDYPRPKYPTFEACHLAVRSQDMRIPFHVMATEDGVELTLWDKDNRTRALLSIGEDCALLEFRNAKGKPIAQLTEAEDGSGQFCVCDAEGNPRAGMRVSELGGTVNTVDKEGEPQAVLLGAEAGGQVFITNNNRQMAVKLISAEKGGVITVHELSGQIMGFLSADADTGSLGVYGPLGDIAVGLLANDSGGSILFNDAEGKHKAMLP
jgi:hypothetical protein